MMEKQEKTYIVVVIAPYVVAQLMTKHPSDILVYPEPIIPICSQSQLDRLSTINV